MKEITEKLENHFMLKKEYKDKKKTFDKSIKGKIANKLKDNSFLLMLVPALFFATILMVDPIPGGLGNQTFSLLFMFLFIAFNFSWIWNSFNIASGWDENKTITPVYKEYIIKRMFHMKKSNPELGESIKKHFTVLKSDETKHIPLSWWRKLDNIFSEIDEIKNSENEEIKPMEEYINNEKTNIENHVTVKSKINHMSDLI